MLPRVFFCLSFKEWKLLSSSRIKTELYIHNALHPGYRRLLGLRNDPPTSLHTFLSFFADNQIKSDQGALQ